LSDLTPSRRWHAPAIATLVALSVGLAACGDDPFRLNWSDAPDTVQIYSLSRPELNLQSGFSFVPPPAATVIERPGATGGWDVALDTQGGELVLMPPGALGITSRAALSIVGAVNFDDVRQAPEDTLLYDANRPASLSPGVVYVVRSNRAVGSYGSSCVYYAKMEPVTIDVGTGTLKFRYVASPVCNSRDLVAPN